MSRLSILLLIGICLSFPISAQEYQPPTDPELWAWWLSLSSDEKIDFIRNYDIIEHTVPEIIFPETNAILTDKNDLVIFPPDNEYLKINIYTLSYEAEIPVYIIPEFLPPNNAIWDKVEGGIIGFFIGLPLGFIIGKL